MFDNAGKLSDLKTMIQERCRCKLGKLRSYYKKYN